MCVCCSFSWTTVEPVQICAAVFFVCLCACLYGQFFPGVNCWSSTNGRCWGVGLRAVVCSWNICLCFSWVKLWSGVGRRGEATKGGSRLRRRRKSQWRRRKLKRTNAKRQQWLLDPWSKIMPNLIGDTCILCSYLQDVWNTVRVCVFRQVCCANVLTQTYMFFYPLTFFSKNNLFNLALYLNLGFIYVHKVWYFEKCHREKVKKSYLVLERTDNQKISTRAHLPIWFNNNIWNHTRQNNIN